MRSTGEIRIPSSRLIREHLKVTVYVTGLRVMRMRLSCALLLFRLGAWIAGTGVQTIQLDERAEL